MPMVGSFILRTQPIDYLLTYKFYVVFMMIFRCVNGSYECCVFSMCLLDAFTFLVYVVKCILIHGINQVVKSMCDL
jgi:hypothetical protein